MRPRPDAAPGPQHGCWRHEVRHGDEARDPGPDVPRDRGPARDSLPGLRLRRGRPEASGPLPDVRRGRLGHPGAGAAGTLDRGMAMTGGPARPDAKVVEM